MDQVHFAYSVFGLVLRSNLPIPGLPPLEAPPKTVDVEIHLGVSQDAERERSYESLGILYSSSYTDESGQPAWQIRASANGSLLHLTYCDGMQFWLDRKGMSLTVAWPSTACLEDATSYLLGPVLGILLRLRGVTCLHASAVTLEDHCVVFAGSEGAGKSTTAAAFARQGYAVLSDDIVALVEREGTLHAMPAYPQLCLWPDSVKMLYGSPDALPPLTPDWDKRRLALGNERARFQSRPLPLAAIYILGDRHADSALCIEPVRPRAALLSLVADTYANRILSREMRAREFEVLGRLVTTVPARRIHASMDSNQLDELCRAIREDVQSLSLPVTSRP
ncbi:MAG: hypothetical protein DMG35_04050 [Acidobacteria bacterium]|nr:MAG: hypothetical protein DMG35_04050 [Acidobacteriota bacterium]